MMTGQNMMPEMTSGYCQVEDTMGEPQQWITTTSTGTLTTDSTCHWVYDPNTTPIYVTPNTPYQPSIQPLPNIQPTPYYTTPLPPVGYETIESLVLNLDLDKARELLDQMSLKKLEAILENIDELRSIVVAKLVDKA